MNDELNKKNDPAAGKITVEIDETTARGVYTNVALISHTETEFVLDLMYLEPQAPKARVVSRAITSPAHAKQLLMALEENVKKYEARFGSIPLRKDMPNQKIGFYH